MGLLALCDEHASAVEFDLLSMNFRLRWLDDPPAHDFNWRDLQVVVQNSPRSSALAVSMEGEVTEWSLTNQLMAASVDALRWLQWAKSKGAQKGDRPPEPIPRPGVEPEYKTIGTETMEPLEAIDWLGDRFEHLRTEYE